MFASAAKSTIRLMLITFLSVCASAQNPPLLSGNLSDSTTGPLIAGTVYRVVGQVTVPVNKVLTVQQGVVLKMDSGLSFYVDGTLNCLGAVGNPIVVTDINDDSVGGDTNNNGGATSPQPGWWTQLLFRSGSSGNLTYCEFRYGGGGVAGVVGVHGQTSVFASDNLFRDNSSPAVSVANINQAAHFTNCTTINNAFNCIYVLGGPSTNAISTLGNLGCPLYVASQIIFGGGTSTTLAPGVVVKMDSSNAIWIVDGALNCQGTPGSPVVFTDSRDDTVGGDTNNNGSSTGPQAGWWTQLLFRTGSSGNLTSCEFRYGGGGVAGVVGVHGQTSVFASNNLFRDNSSPAVSVANINQAAHFTNCTTINNAFNCIYVLGGPSTNANATLGNLGCPLYIASQIIFGGGTSTTLAPGVVVKMDSSNANWIVDGALNCLGTAGSPVVFTDSRDDTIGGDTNNNGSATGPQAGWWTQLLFRSGSSGKLTSCEFRYGGSSVAGVVGVHGQTSVFASNSLFRDNSSPAVSVANINQAARFTNCTTINNSFNCIYVLGGPSTNANATLGNLGCPLYVASQIIFGSGTSTTLAPGVVVKMDSSNANWIVDGALHCRGTAGNPVVFTDARDDTVGGDSNNDFGQSIPRVGSWSGLALRVGSASSLANVIVRYCGSGGVAGIASSSSVAKISDCRVEYANSAGFTLGALAGEARGLSAWHCDVGINLSGGTFDVRQATCVANTTGLRNTPSWTGTVRDSIAWANSLVNFSVSPPAGLIYSDGILGGVGNIDVDPLFVDMAAGDLHLLPSSPCIDMGDVNSPRDPDCSIADMGAYPFDHGFAPFTYCTGKLNSAGCTPYVTFTGFPSASSNQPFVVRAFDVLNNKSGLFFYGFSGPVSAPFQGGTKCVASPIKRLSTQLSGGSATGTDCSGVFVQDFNARIQSQVDPLLVSGATVNVQCWYRDPASASTTGLSDGLEFHICQ